MLNIDFEFRKGIFFIRFIGKMNEINIEGCEELKNIITINKFKYIVLNTNYIREINLSGIKYLYDLCYLTSKMKSNLVLCDKNMIMQRLLNNNYPTIKSEIEVL